MDLQALLDELAAEAAPHAARGRVADYIPALAAVDPARFGIALATMDGRVCGSGDWRVPFSIQSVSKAFSLALVLARDGEELWRRVGREPSGNPFNSLVQLEYEKGIPRNPFINAGALVLIDRLLTLTGDSLGTLRAFLRTESGNAALDLDPEVAVSEATHGHRNAGPLKDEADLVRLVREHARPGDMVVCLGAGNITAWAHALPGQIQQLAAEKAGPRAIANDADSHGGSAA